MMSRGWAWLKVHIGCACGVSRKHGRGWVGILSPGRQGSESRPSSLQVLQACNASLYRLLLITFTFTFRFRYPQIELGLRQPVVRFSFFFCSRARRRAAMCLAYLEA